MKLYLKDNHLSFLDPLHRGAFCQFPLRWIYYYGSNKSIGKETGKTHLCALYWFPSQKEEFWPRSTNSATKGGVLYLVSLSQDASQDEKTRYKIGPKILVRIAHSINFDFLGICATHMPKFRYCEKATKIWPIFHL